MPLCPYFRSVLAARRKNTLGGKLSRQPLCLTFKMMSDRMTLCESPEKAVLSDDGSVSGVLTAVSVA